MARTTRTQIEHRAAELAALTGWDGAVIHGGSKTNGVAWMVTLYSGSTYATATETTTFRAGMTAGESWTKLDAMVEGIRLRLYGTPRK